jgi:hypothetical protein
MQINLVFHVEHFNLYPNPKSVPANANHYHYHLVKSRYKKNRKNAIFGLIHLRIFLVFLCPFLGAFLKLWRRHFSYLLLYHFKKSQSQLTVEL